MREGDVAPDFEAVANNGEKIRLSSFKDKKNVVLCFYPKNRLFMCPSKKVFKMAQSVISAYGDILKTDSVLFAISVDTVDDQAAFVERYNIPYLHLSDTTKDVCKKYAGLNLAGLAKRSTFIVGKNGTIRNVFYDIDVESHGKQIAQALSKLNG
ncbi:redoxin domain-containing protein [Candidatus Nitrosotenuis chungbukensis]|uniref:peroxiredoxin family protein n=1 Tax=Candidatus Nitrosotenuis chungbukensis TaxID=1353246 RepID=UPI002673705F|nr:redoxin domain-containing protein [Candidatus Nitrosotenuis chungbukensis]WKT57802.1 redoxin domain-containing protein [Candidatus Nitrosotenuis chungbukensis]